jgi:hypothetical protein
MLILGKYVVLDEPEGLKCALQMKQRGSTDIVGFSAQDIYGIG